MADSRVRMSAAVMIALLTCAVYLPALDNEFVNWDDDRFVYRNLNIRSLDGPFLLWALTDTTLSHWRPVVWLSHAIDYAVWGLNPMGHHLTNVLFHGLNTFVVVLLTISLAHAAQASPVTRHAGVREERSLLLQGCIAGILFGLHPLHVESVAWVTERKDVLYAFFFLLSIAAYRWYLIRPAADGRNEISFRPDGRYLLALGLFLMALASKPMAVTLPLILLVLDWYPFRRIRSLRDCMTAGREKIPFLAGSVIVSAITLSAQKDDGLMPVIESIGVAERGLVAFRSVVLYLWKMLVPVHLVPFYPYPEQVPILSVAYGGSLILIGGITALSVYAARRKQPLLLAAWCYYVISLLPVLGVVRVGSYAMADRYTYLSSLGPFLVLGAVAARAWKKKLSVQESRPAALVLPAAAVLLVVVLSILTIRQIAVWENSLTLWTYVLEKEPRGNPLAHTNRGAAYVEAGAPERALEDFSDAIAIDPAEYTAYNNRGVLFRKLGQHDRALEDFGTALMLKPDYADALLNRGLVFRDMGMADQAIGDFSASISMRPTPAAYTHRGMVRYEQGDAAQAIADFSAAIARDPSSADALISRGLVLIEVNRLDEAWKDLDRAVRLTPESADAYLNRGVVHERLGEYGKAIQDYGRALTLNPSDALAFRNRGLVHSRTGDVDTAIEDLSRAVALSPESAQTFLDRGDLYRRVGQEARALSDYERACVLGSAAGCEAGRAESQR